MNTLPVSLAITAALLCGAAWSQIEAPAAPFETRPWPADGAVLAANPPAFVWVPAEPADGYELQYSQDGEFADDGTTRVETPWLIHVPTTILEPGTWHWRWRPANSVEWSMTREFAISDDAVEVPFPDVSAVIDRLGTTHPRVAVQADELDELRAWAAQTQGRLLEGIRRDAEQALTEDLLPEPEMLPARDDPERAPVYVRIFQTTRPVFRRMSRFAEGYLLSGDETMARAAARLLMNFLSWDPGGSTSLGHNDEPATEFVRYCPRVYDWIYPVLTTEERETCRDVMQARMAEMYGRWDNRPFERFPYESHNMGYYLPDMLEASLAMAGDLDTEEMLRYCMMQLWSPYYPPYGGDDGGWQEGPPYWGWVADVFARTCYLVEQNTGAPIAQRSSLRNQAMWKLYANPPHAKMSPFGDGQAGASGGAGTMYRLAALYQDPYALWFASQKNYSPSGLEAWMWDVSDLEPREPIDLPQSKCFPSVGEACMHSALWSPADNVQLLFRSCPFGGISHAYADQNTFALDAFGEPLIIASGYYPYYGSPHHVQWTRKTVASNSVLVNGEGQPETWNWDARGEITRFESSAYADYAVGQAKEAYPGILNDFRRRILFARPLLTGGPAIIAIHDELAAEEPSGYQWMLHSLDEMAVDETRQRVTVRRADARCRVDYLLPRGLAFSQTDQFTVPPERGDPNQWHLTASLEEKATERQSLLVILPHRARESETLPESEAVDGEGCVAARVRDEGIEHILIFKAPGADMAVIPEMGLRTDAEAVALTLEGGRARASFAAGGTMLEVGGTRLAMPTTGEVTTPSAPASRLVLEDGTTIEMPVEVFPLVGRARYSARYDGPTGHHELVVRARRSRAKPCPITVGAGKTESRWTPENSDDWQEHVTPLMDIATGARIGLTLDSTEGGNCEVESVTVRRAYGRNLLPNASFEDISPSGAVLGWRAGTITNDAQSTLESAEDGRDGSRCARITCTKAGGDFGAYVGWPGVSPVDYDRRFRVGVWVRNDAESSVGIQITDVSWQFHQTTNKIADNAEWTETSREFTLPAGEDLTNLRLHMHAEREGAVMRVDDAYLVELPPE